MSNLLVRRLNASCKTVNNIASVADASALPMPWPRKATLSDRGLWRMDSIYTFKYGSRGDKASKWTTECLYPVVDLASESNNNKSSLVVVNGGHLTVNNLGYIRTLMHTLPNIAYLVRLSQDTLQAERCPLRSSAIRVLTLVWGMDRLVWSPGCHNVSRTTYSIRSYSTLSRLDSYTAYVCPESSLSRISVFIVVGMSYNTSKLNVVLPELTRCTTWRNLMKCPYSISSL